MPPTEPLNEISNDLTSSSAKPAILFSTDSVTCKKVLSSLPLAAYTAEMRHIIRKAPKRLV